MRLLKIAGLALLASAVSGSLQAATTASQAVIARVGGKPITRSELDRQQGGKLLAADYSRYLAERAALDIAIDTMLLQEAAARERTSVSSLLARHVKVNDPPEAALRAIYDGMETEQPYDSLRERILQHIRQARQIKARAAYLKTLRAQTRVVVYLEPPTAEVALGKAPVRGNPAAPVTLIEFADYECPYCREIEPSMRKLREQFGDQLRVAFKNMPLPMHQHAEKAAEAALCAQAQDQYWSYHDSLFDSGDLGVSSLKERARKLGLDMAKFDHCLDSGAEQPEVKADFEQGQALGLTGTPGFFINGHFLSGAVTYDTLRDLVQQQLAQGHPAMAMSGR